MPALVDRLQTMMTTLEARSVALHDRQIESQQAFSTAPSARMRASRRMSATR